MTCAFQEMLDLAGRLGLVVRHAPLGGNGGGIALFRRQRHLFIDLDAAGEDQLEQTAKALAGVPEVQNVFVRPDVRALLESYLPGGK